MDLQLDCAQPLYLVHMKENAGEASVKRAALGRVCEGSEQGEIERL